MVLKYFFVFCLSKKHTEIYYWISGFGWICTALTIIGDSVRSVFRPLKFRKRSTRVLHDYGWRFRQNLYIVDENSKISIEKIDKTAKNGAVLRLPSGHRDGFHPHPLHPDGGGWLEVLCSRYFRNLFRQIKVTVERKESKKKPTCSANANIVMGYVIGNADISHSENCHYFWVLKGLRCETQMYAFVVYTYKWRKKKINKSGYLVFPGKLIFNIGEYYAKYFNFFFLFRVLSLVCITNKKKVINK